MDQPDVHCLRSLWLRLLARCKGLRGESGNAMIELALIISALGIPLVVGVSDMGFAVYDSIEVSMLPTPGPCTACGVRRSRPAPQA